MLETLSIEKKHNTKGGQALKEFNWICIQLVALTVMTWKEHV